MSKRKSELLMQFNSIVEKVNDSTICEATLIIHDFEESWNGQVITEEICAENMNTLVNKRIVCKYINAEDNEGLDTLTDHEECYGKDRNGNDIIITDTMAIGFIKEVYIGDHVDSDDNSKRVLFAKATLWNDDKYKNVIGLLKDWLDRGIKINMSCEYLYANYKVENGVEYIQSPIIYTGHCLLGSEDRGSYEKIDGAYDIAECLSLNQKQVWNKAINRLLNTKKEDTMEFKNEMLECLKSLNAISLGDFRWKLYDALAKVMIAEDYNCLYLSNYNIFVAEGYFIFEKWNSELETYEHFKVTFTVDENDAVTVDYEGRQKVEYQLVATDMVETMTTSLNEKEVELEGVKNELETVKTSLNSKVTELETLTSEKNEALTKLNESNELAISLNSKIETLTNEVKEMQPLVEKYNEEVFEKALNKATEFYKEKFEKVNALDVFDLEETQELIKKSINSKTVDEKFKLNQLIVDSVKSTIAQEDTTPMNKSINSVEKGKENKNLLSNAIDKYEDYAGIKR